MTKESIFPEGYNGSTKAELHHRLGNNYVLVKMAVDGRWEPDDLSTFVTKSKESFIAGLQRAVDNQFPVFGGVTHDQLKTVIKLAKTSDWTSSDELQQLADFCRELQEPAE